MDRFRIIVAYLLLALGCASISYGVTQLVAPRRDLKMGMFDEIMTPEILCPKCKEPVTGFQSKDGPCDLTVLSFKEVQNFYSNCRKCDTWVEYFLKVKPSERTIEDYEQSHRLKE